MGLDLRSGDDAGPDGIHLDVAEDEGEAGEGNHTGEEAALPEVAGQAASGVEILGVAAMDTAEEDGHGVGPGGAGEPVDVIGHEAIGQQGEGAVGEMGMSELEVDGAVRRGEKNLLVVVAALSNVKEGTGFDETSIAGHYLMSVRYP